jgi:putative transposase
MCLRFVFLLTMRLSRRKETWKTAEILILRHQLAVLQRQQPRRLKLNWADRAVLATLTLLEASSQQTSASARSSENRS